MGRKGIGKNRMERDISGRQVVGLENIFFSILSSSLPRMEGD